MEKLLGVTMAASQRHSTKYPGVFYRIVRRISSQKDTTEKVFYIVFKKNGKIYEEKVGRQFADNMTEAKAAIIRSERIEGKRLSRQEIKHAQEQAALEEQRKTTIGKIWEEYQVLRKSKKSLITDQYNFSNHLQGFSNKKPDELRTLDIEKLRNELENKKLSLASVKHILVLLRMLINWGVKQGMCKQPDPSLLTFDMPKLDNERTEMLTPEQLMAYQRAIDEELDQNAAAIFKLALVTGMRKGALLALKWEDCDFENMMITLRGDAAKKGKTDKIPMNDAASKVLQSIDRTDSPFVFPGKNGGQRVEIKRMARRIKERAGLPADFRPMHGLRHTYASLLASSGKVDLYTLQKLMTHSSPKMTQRYAHLADEALKRAASVINEVLSFEKD